MSRAKFFRWSKRILLGLLAFLVIAVGLLLVVIHTDWGRGKIKAQVESALADTFTGGGTIGRLEGSPFGELRAYDVVINGPDGKPAITVKEARLQITLTDLIDKHANIDYVAAEGVEILMKRDPDGELQFSRLTKPGPSGGWAVDIQTISVRDGHLVLDDNNFDELELGGVLAMSPAGRIVIDAIVRGRWREPRAPIVAMTRVVLDGDVTAFPTLFARVGDLTAVGDEITITTPPTIEIFPGIMHQTRPDLPPALAGELAVSAPKHAVLDLFAVELPGDMQVRTTVTTNRPWTNLDVSAFVGGQRATANVGIDLATLEAAGWVDTGTLDIGMLSMGRVAGRGAATAVFHVKQVEGAELPSAIAIATVRGEIAEAPYAEAVIVASTHGDSIVANVSASGEAADARIAAMLTRRGDALVLDHATLVAKTSNPERASDGCAPVTGRIEAELVASGALLPATDLAVRGRIDGSRIAAAGVSASTLKVGIDAKHLPGTPAGRVELFATNLRQGDVLLRELALTAGSRADGKIAIALRSKPKQDPWAVELDALVDLGTDQRIGELPSAVGDPITIDLTRHLVKVKGDGTWKGDRGEIVISASKITLRDFASSNGGSKVAASMEMLRTGRNAGDLTARVEGSSFDLATLHQGYAGKLDVEATITRRDGLFAGDLAVSALAVSFLPTQLIPVDLDLEIKAGPNQLLIDGELGSMTMGDVRIVADVQAPRDITDVASWQKLERPQIRTARINLDSLKVNELAQLLDLPPDEYQGEVSGELDLSATQLGGQIKLVDFQAPPLRGIGELDATIDIGTDGPRILTPRIVTTIDNLGKLEASATIELPEKLFSPGAWSSLGRASLQGAAVKLYEVQVDPAMLERFGIVTNIRGKVTGDVAVTAGMKSITLTARAADVRGSPIAQPLTLDALATIDERGTNAKVTLVTLPVPDRASAVVLRRPMPLVEITTTIPVTTTDLVRNPAAVLEAELDVVATIPDLSAAQIMATFGRSEIRSGRLSGTVEVSGTVADPTVRANIAVTDLASNRVSRRGKPRSIKRMQIDATWQEGAALVNINGEQTDGMLQLQAIADTSNLSAGSVRVQAKNFDLAPLFAFAPGPAAGGQGTLTADLKIVGLDARTARIAGDLHLSNARMPISPEVGTLRRASVDITVSERDLQVAVDGRLGGGTVKLTGTFGMNGTRPTNGDVKIELRQVSPIGEIEPDIDADVFAKLHIEPTKWVADVDIKNATVDVPDDRGEPLKEIGAPEDMYFVEAGQEIAERKQELAALEAEADEPIIPAFQANITLHSTYVKSTELRGLVTGKLRVDIDGGAHLGMFGAIEAERGDLDLFGRRYQVDRAQVRFDGTVDPLLDVVISHDFPDVTTTTQVRGRVSKPEVILASNPGTYSQGQLLGFLLGGEPSGEPSSGNPRDKVTSAGASLVGNQLGGYVKDKLPVDIDVLKYEAATSTNSQSVTVGSWITQKLFIAYRQRVGARVDENNGEAEVEYYLTRRLVVEGIVGDKNRNGIDLLWRKRY